MLVISFIEKGCIVALYIVGPVHLFTLLVAGTISIPRIEYRCFFVLCCFTLAQMTIESKTMTKPPLLPKLLTGLPISGKGERAELFAGKASMKAVAGSRAASMAKKPPRVAKPSISKTYILESFTEQSSIQGVNKT